jgi:catechol 2,3-dioxygenase-like lactoylglutathione lyase family enzyme
MDLHLEVVQVPVSDVDRAKRFYTDQVGFHTDHDTRLSDAVRVVQLTPPGSACSIVIGSGLSEMEPGCLEGLQLTVIDMDEVRDQLIDRGVAVSDVKILGRPGRPGFKHAYFRDPDDNGWTVQEIPEARGDQRSEDEFSAA